MKTATESRKPGNEAESPVRVALLPAEHRKRLKEMMASLRQLERNVAGVIALPREGWGRHDDHDEPGGHLREDIRTLEGVLSVFGGAISGALPLSIEE